jgi:hypothetical protein
MAQDSNQGQGSLLDTPDVKPDEKKNKSNRGDQAGEQKADPPKSKLPVIEDRDYIFKLVDNTRNGGINIGGVDDVINPDTGRMERIRLLAGVESIWVKDQKDIKEEYINQNTRSLEFRGKILRVPAYDKAMILFALLTRHNTGSAQNKSGSRTEFFEWNPAKQAEAGLKKEILEMETVAAVSNLSEEKLRQLASYFKISNEGEYGIPKLLSQIRTEMMLQAKRNPENVKKMMDSDEVTAQWTIKQAILNSKIDLGSQQGSALWASGGLITKLPPGKIPLETLTDLFMSPTDEGRQFKEQLKNLK